MPAPSIDQLKSSFRGELIQPADAAYESARKVYNGMIDKRPQLIARCVDVADVMAAVNFGRDNQMLTAIRGGGHNGAGLGTCDGGLVIDLSRMKGIRVDPAAKTVRVEAGCVWGDVDHATHAFGMATPCGFISTTGVGGLTLGGGIGYLTRQYGLTIDNLLSVDMVLADGSFVTANADENTDLFWAVRGGGGNFGVVTSFVFRLHPVSMVNFGPTFWPLEQAADVLRAYRKFIVDAPENISGFFGFPGSSTCAHVSRALAHEESVRHRVVLHRIAGRDRGGDQVDALRGQPLLDHVGPAPFPVVQSIFDGLFVSWPAVVLARRQFHRIERRSHRAACRAWIQAADHALDHASVSAQWRGPARRQDRYRLQFSRSARSPKSSSESIPIPPTPRRSPTWCKEYWDALHPFSAGGAYVNFMMDEGQDRIQAAFRDNYARLAAIKKKYDPTNFFRVNQNIRP